MDMTAVRLANRKEYSKNKSIWKKGYYYEKQAYNRGINIMHINFNVFNRLCI